MNPDRHVLEVGDALEALEALPDDHGDAAVVDYPWPFDTENGTNRFGHDLETGDSDLFDVEPLAALPDVLDELERVVAPGGWILCFADDEFQDPLRFALEGADGLEFRRNWAWEPKQFGMGYYGRVGHYPIPVATVGDTDRYVQDRSTLYSVDSAPDVEYPTAKPVELYRALLAPPVLEDDETLLEPFCGSAPGAGVAAERDLEYWAVDARESAVAHARERLGQTPLSAWNDVAADGGRSE